MVAYVCVLRSTRVVQWRRHRTCLKRLAEAATPALQWGMVGYRPFETLTCEVRDHQSTPPRRRYVDEDEGGGDRSRRSLPCVWLH